MGGSCFGKLAVVKIAKRQVGCDRSERWSGLFVALDDLKQVKIDLDRRPSIPSILLFS